MNLKPTVTKKNSDGSLRVQDCMSAAFATVTKSDFGWVAILDGKYSDTVSTRREAVSVAQHWISC